MYQAYEKGKELCKRLFGKRYVYKVKMPKGVVQYW